MSAHYKSLTRRTSPDVVAIFPLNGTVLLPGCDLPLNIFEPRYLNMVDDALKGERLIGMIQTDDDRDSGVSKVGGLGRISQFAEQEDGRYLIVLKGLKRFNFVKDEPSPAPYRQAHISYDGFEEDAELHDPRALPDALTDIGGKDRAALTVAMKSLAKVMGVSVDWDGLKEIPLPQLVNQAAMISPFKPADKQSLLEAISTEDRRKLLTGLLHLYASTGGEAPDQPAN